MAKKLNNSCNFPWLLSNVKLEGGEPLVDTKDYHIEERNGVKIGIIGLAEFDWISTLRCYELSDLDYEDISECGERMAIFLSKYFPLKNF